MIGAGEPERSYRVTRSLPDRARTLLVQGFERCTMEDRRTIVSMLKVAALASVDAATQ
jgi:hypothetical protein